MGTQRSQANGPFLSWSWGNKNDFFESDVALLVFATNVLLSRKGAFGQIKKDYHFCTDVHTLILMEADNT